MLAAVGFLLAWWSVLLGIAAGRFPGDIPGWAGAMLIAGMLLPVPLAVVLFNKHPLARIRRLSREEFLAELEARGRLRREEHVATRALRFEDSPTGGVLYLIESQGRGVLTLHGQYLYQYEPTDPGDVEQGEAPEPRTFPTTRFVLLRDGDDPAILDIERSGEVFAPEDVPEPVGDLYAELTKWNADGRLLAAPGFDEWRARLLRTN